MKIYYPRKNNKPEKGFSFASLSIIFLLFSFLDGEERNKRGEVFYGSEALTIERKFHTAKSLTAAAAAYGFGGGCLYHSSHTIKASFVS